MAKNKIKVAVIFGGRSAEHEVSIISAQSIISALDRKKYKIIPIGITKSGKWLSAGEPIKLLKSGRYFKKSDTILPAEPTKKALKNLRPKLKIDVIFPVLHGPYGEDGTIQGLFELAGIPYVGAGVLGSAVGMDKIIQKQLFKQAGLPVVKFIWFLSKEINGAKLKKIVRLIEQEIGYPCFVKPANLGSSIGISKAHNKKELIKALKQASKYDRKVMVEEGIEGAREIECAVLGNDWPKASVLGEVRPSNEFYDYDAKYIDGKSDLIIPASLPKKISKKIRQMAISAFKSIDCSGMARVDFLIRRKDNKIYLSEINTIPGFTAISMYPKLWQASGLSYPKLIDRLIQLSLERHKEKSKLKTSYQPKTEWYK